MGVTPSNGSRSARISVATRSRIDPTERHAMRKSDESVVLSVRTASHATVSSKLLVKPLPCLAQGA